MSVQDSQTPPHTAIITRLQTNDFKIEFFKNGQPFTTHVWKSADTARASLKKAGLEWTRAKKGCVWPVKPEHPVLILIPNPTAWFWTK